ncbi:hypothetical protein KJ810_00270 [Patescibacteria group bacterium]|nr:hypothetical protein [Patescibacteria group bacterium]MBU2235844.1 hypothetical protein [Patescibacteria group bacterium]
MDVCITRDKKRKNTHGKLAAEAIHRLASQFDCGTIIDVSGKSINQIVEEINSNLL